MGYLHVFGSSVGIDVSAVSDGRGWSRGGVPPANEIVRWIYPTPANGSFGMGALQPERSAVIGVLYLSRERDRTENENYYPKQASLRYRWIDPLLASLSLSLLC